MTAAAKTERRAHFARTLRELRKATNMSRREVAERASLHVSEVEKLEAAHHLPGLDALRRLAGALEIPVADLFAGITWQPPTSDCHGFYRITEPEDKK